MNADDRRRGSQLLAAALLRDVERIAERGVARMQELLPAYAKVPRQELIPVTATNTRNLLEAIRDPEGERAHERAAYRASGATRARQGITSDEMLNAWRIGLESVREEAHVVAREAGIGTSALLEFIEATLRWGDLGMRTSAPAHHEAEIRELGRLVEEQAALRRVATLVAHGVRPADVFAAVCDEVGRAIGAAAGVVRYESDGAAIVAASSLLPVGTRLELEESVATSAVYRTGRSARSDGTDRLSRAGAGGRLGVVAAVASPIVVERRLWGAMVVSSREEPLPDGVEERLENFTELVATAIANADAREQIERLAAEQAALRRVATLVAGESPAAEILAKVAEEVGLLLSVPATAIWRFDDDGRATVVASWGERRDTPPVGLRTAPAGVGAIAGVACEIVVNGRVWGAIAAATPRSEPVPGDAEARVRRFTELVATAISNVEARAEAAASRARIAAAADDERRRVVRDLHDGAQARLVHTIVTLKLARRDLARYGADAPAVLDEPLAHAEKATHELRELARGILPSALTRVGLAEAVTELAATMSIPVDADVMVDRLPGAVEATAYFIVAEALTNVVKHARATRAVVTAKVAGDGLRLAVRDDGAGGARVDGAGLVGLSDRLAALGGRLCVESPAGGGTVVAAWIPIAKAGSTGSAAERGAQRRDDRAADGDRCE